MSRGRLKCLAAGKIEGQIHEPNASVKSPSTAGTIFLIKMYFLNLNFGQDRGFSYFFRLPAYSNTFYTAG